MSNRELAKSLIDQIPESRMYYVISYLQGAAVPDETPNSETIAAMEELKKAAVHCLPEVPKIYLHNLWRNNLC